MESDFSNLLLHTEVRWLSRGKCLQRLFDLREEVETVLERKASELVTFLKNKEWLLKLTYLVDVMNHLNVLNLSLQGKKGTIFETEQKIETFKKKLSIWRKKIQAGNTSMFPTYTDFLDTVGDKEYVHTLEHKISEHLLQMETYFERYFPSSKRSYTQFPWIVSPFTVEIAVLNLDSLLEEELIELSCDKGMENLFSSVDLLSFWSTVSSNYTNIGSAAMRAFLPFPTTYLCELGFSTLATLKYKKRNRLNAAADMRVAVSTIVPQWNILVEKHQEHPSH